jgi:hypothetical protein
VIHHALPRVEVEAVVAGVDRVAIGGKRIELRRDGADDVRLGLDTLNTISDGVPGYGRGLITRILIANLSCALTVKPGRFSCIWMRATQA